MTLKATLRNELHQLSADPSRSMPTSLTADTPEGRISAQLVDVDALACAFQDLAFQTDRLANTSVDELKKVCETIAKKLHYLLEPIQAVEVDADACVVQMRSIPPQKDEDGTSYYELLARRGGQIQLCRYNKQRGAERQVVPATVTREVFVRLAIDLSTGVNP